MKQGYLLLFLMIIGMSSTAFAFTGAGSGTSVDPFQIDSCELLNETRLALSAFYALNQTIDCDVDPFNINKGFDPIGNDIAGGGADNFKGDFNGRGFYINNLFIDFDRRYVGLFGFISTSAVIHNLNFMNVNLSNPGFNGSLGAVAGRFVCCTLENISVVGNSVINGQNTGGIVGQNFVGGKNIFANLTVTADAGTVGGLFGFLAMNAGEFLINAHFVGSVTGVDKVGGLIGNLDTSGSFDPTLSGIINASADAIVIGNNRVGGLIGDGEGSLRILNSSASGTVTGNNDVGGFIGELRNTGGPGVIFDSLFTTSTVAGASNVGGFIGLLELGSDITNSYAQGDVSGSSNVGGFVGTMQSGGTTITNAYATGNVIATGSSAGGFIGNYISAATITNTFSFGEVTAGGTFGGYSGDDTITVVNCHWFNQTNNPNTDSPTTSNCGAANAETDPNFFTGDTFPLNQPMASWPFFDIWSELQNDFAVLTFQGIGTNLSISLPINITNVNGSINITFPIRWSTSIFATSQINFGTTLALGTIVSDTSFVKEHFIRLHSLPENTTFFFNVSGINSPQNETVGPFNFTTPGGQISIADNVTAVSGVDDLGAAPGIIFGIIGVTALLFIIAFSLNPAFVALKLLFGSTGFYFLQSITNMAHLAAIDAEISTTIISLMSNLQVAFFMVFYAGIAMAVIYGIIGGVGWYKERLAIREEML